MTQIKKLIPSLTEQWKRVYEKERPNLVPNAITGEELVLYAQNALRAEPVSDEAFCAAIAADVKNNAFFAEKLNGAEPDPVALRGPDGSFIGIDRVSGWFIAEDDRIRDRLTFAKGLDEKDLDNVLRTVDWLRCKKAAEADRKTGCIAQPKKPQLPRKRLMENREEEK